MPATTTAWAGSESDVLLETERAGGESPDLVDAMHLVFEEANRLLTRGELEAAERRYAKAGEFAAQAGLEANVAAARGQIANILAIRGELDEALRIRREEELPVFERLGEVHELLVARANLAMLLQKGDAEGRAEACVLLCLALADAQSLGTPEGDQIEQILAQQEMECA